MNIKIIKIIKNFGFNNLFKIFTLLITSSILEIFVVSSLFVFATYLIDENSLDKFTFFKIIDEFLNLDSKTNFIIFLVFILFISNTLLNFLFVYSKYQIEKIIWKQHRNVSLNYFFKLFDQGIVELEKKRLSEQYSKIISELVAVFSVQVNSVFEIFSKIISIIIIIIILFFINYKITFLAITFCFCLLLFFYFILKPQVKKLGKRNLEFSRERLNTVIQIFNSMREIKLYKNINFFLNYDVIFKKLMKNSLKLNLLQKLPKHIMEPLFLLLLFIVFFILDFNFNINKFLPIIGVFIYSTLRVLPSINSIILSYNSINTYKQSLNEIYDDIKNIDHKESIFLNKDNFNKNIIDFNNKFSKLSFQNIRYKFSENSFSCNFTFEILREKKYVIVGPNGSGKSTLLNIFLGLINPDSGEIFIDEKKTKNLNYSNWQKNISLVPQKVYLMNSSLLNNIIFDLSSNSKVDENLLRLSLDVADIDLKKFPVNLNSELLENGKNLSGGQIQKIVLARAIYRNSDILILDEALNSIDNNSKKIIQKKINNLKKTILQISHEFDDIENEDDIICIEKGKVKYQGKKKNFSI